MPDVAPVITTTFPRITFPFDFNPRLAGKTERSTSHCVCGLGRRQHDRELRSTGPISGKMAAGGDCASVLFNDLFGQPESQPGSSIDFGRKERLEDPAQISLADSRTGVLDFSPHARSIGSYGVGDAHSENSGIAHGFDCVGDDVGKDLLDLPARRAHRPAYGVLAPNLDAMQRELMIVKGQRVVKQIGECELRPGAGIAEEAERAPANGGNAVDLLLGNRYVFPA